LRIACVLLPDFEASLEIARRPELAGRPVVVGGLPHERKSVRSRSTEAAAHGVTEGMPLSRAQGLCPDAAFLPMDDESYRGSFGRILGVLDEFSPTIEIEGAHAFYLDAEGLGLLFGPEEELGRRIVAAVEKVAGIRSRVGIGSGKFVARTAAMVATAESVLVVGKGEERAFLSPLPVSLLPCSPETLRRLQLLGLRNMGRLAEIEAGLPAEQFGPEGTDLHRLARGIDESPLTAREIPLLLEERIEIDPPTDRSDLLLAAADRLLRRLEARMQADYLACREVQIGFALTGESEKLLAATLHEPASGRAALGRAVERLLARLYSPLPMGEGRGEGITHPPSPISALRIALSGFGGRQGEQMELFRSRAGNLKRLRETVRESEDQFGEGAIRPLTEVATERSAASQLPVRVDAAGRPRAILLDGRWEGVRELCNRWRVQEEWWRRERYRDYFRLITDSGRLCLLFRDLLDGKATTETGWFLERVYE
jgi:DNA polymerase IV